MTRFRLALPVALCLALACGTVEDPPSDDGSGSASGNGGSSSGGGDGGNGNGGTFSTGGDTASGGFSNTGGEEASGGSESGGAPSSGGAGDGGDPSSGGSDGTGGTDPGSGGGGSTSAGVCGGDTPHGCYVPRSSNPNGCPPQIYEQSSFYPPPNEWEACSSPPFVPCVYDNPAGGEGECRCNLGQHWLCSY